MLDVKFKMAYANGQTMQKFAEVIQQRMKWCNETARGSIAACAIDALKSIRSKTKVAKASTVKPKLDEDNTIYASVTTQGGIKKMCLRWAGSKQQWHGGEKVHMSKGSPFNSYHVYRYVDENAKTPTSHLFVAISIKEATQRCKQMLVRRMMRYAGLAKTAIGKLIQKAWTGNKNESSGDFRIDSVADSVSSKQETIKATKDGGIYTLALRDNLKYAALAVKGGKSEIDACIRRSLNKIVSVINQKIKKRKNDFFAPTPLDAPFPELKKRK